jgi:hypothetical protein
MRLNQINEEGYVDMPAGKNICGRFRMEKYGAKLSGRGGECLSPLP